MKLSYDHEQTEDNTEQPSVDGCRNKLSAGTLWGDFCTSKYGILVYCKAASPAYVVSDARRQV